MKWCGLAVIVTINLEWRDMYLSILRENIKFMMVICAANVSKCSKPKHTFRGIVKSVKPNVTVNKIKLCIDFHFRLGLGLGDNSMMWTCIECHYQSKTKGHVFEHIEGKHNVHEGYFCQACEKVYKSRASFRMHNKRCQIWIWLLKWNCEIEIH